MIYYYRAGWYIGGITNLLLDILHKKHHNNYSAVIKHVSYVTCIGTHMHCNYLSIVHVLFARDFIRDYLIFPDPSFSAIYITNISWFYKCITMCSLVMSPFSHDFIKTEID